MPASIADLLHDVTVVYRLVDFMDGDSASIGIGQFVHLMRRNLPSFTSLKTTAATA